MNESLSQYVKRMRKEHHLTQVDLCEKSGVGLRFIRELEQGKKTALSLFGSQIGVVLLNNNAPT